MFYWINPKQEKSREREEGLMMARGGKMDEAVFREKLKNMGQVC